MLTRSNLLLSGTLALTLLAAGAGMGSAQSSGTSASDDPMSAAQTLGARTRAEIAHLGFHSPDIERALHLQSEGDQALRRGDPVRAAREYGRAEEAVSVLERERRHANSARMLTRRQLERGHGEGTNMLDAERFNQKGDYAFDNGDYTSSEAYYAMARAVLSNRTARLGAEAHDDNP